MKAVFLGGSTSPTLDLHVDRGDTHLGTGAPIEAWIRTLPRVRQVFKGVWNVIDPGPDIGRLLGEAGFAIDTSSLGAASLGDVLRPLVTPSDGRQGWAAVLPRLSGVAHLSELLPAGAVFTPEEGVFHLPLGDVASLDPDVFRIQRGVTDPPKRWPPTLPAEVLAAVRQLAGAQDLSRVEDRAAFETVVAAVGGIPNWFGLDLYEYQQAGALAAAAGRGAIVDPPGLGKTRQVLAALAVYGARRSVIVTPPEPVVTHWGREAIESGIADNVGENGEVVIWSARRKLAELPEAGILVVPDTLLAARPGLIDTIADWRPDGFAVDEVHRAKTWQTKRSRAVRATARASSGIRLATSGTPMLANVHDMASMLAVTKDLQRTFGGLHKFEKEFCYRDHFDRWRSRKRRLPELKSALDGGVWIRRQKIMPTKKRRMVAFIEPDKKIWREANTDVYKSIDRFIGRFRSEHGGRYPSEGEILAWTREEMGLITLMRRAAGLAKVDAIADRAAEWVEAYTEIDDATGQRTYLRPLIIWTWHQVVSEALAKAVPSRIGKAGVIIGSTKKSERAQLVDAYQAGEVPVLVCSIPTVGVGVTLTRGCDAWFAETSWTPAEVSQAEDRQWRIGQQRDVQVTTFIAPGTLDERIQDTLARKAESLELILTGGDNDVGVLEQSSAEEQTKILLDIVKSRLPRAKKAGRAA